jgi:predicted nuclease of predicted toxin-antitoxin system
VDKLRDIFPDSKHVRFVGLASADDATVWEFAATNQMVTVSKDSDFRQRSFLLGAPPKVISIALGNCSTSAIEQVLKGHVTELERFEADAEAAFIAIAD